MKIKISNQDAVPHVCHNMLHMFGHVDGKQLLWKIAVSVFRNAKNYRSGTALKPFPILWINLIVFINFHTIKVDFNTQITTPGFFLAEHSSRQAGIESKINVIWRQVKELRLTSDFDILATNIWSQMFWTHLEKIHLFE